MRLLYNSKYKWVKKLTYDSEKIYLSEYQSKLLEVLCNGKFNTWNDIAGYMYKKKADKKTINLIRNIFNRLFYKIPLNIVSDYGKRYSINR